MASKLIKPPSKSEAAKITPKKVEATQIINNNNILDFVDEPVITPLNKNVDNNDGDLLGSFDVEPINPNNTSQQIQPQQQFQIQQQ